MNLPKLVNCMGFCFAILFLSCQSKSKAIHMVEKDLLPYGVTLTLQVPDSADINLTDWGLQKDITIKDPGSWYDLQIFSSKALTHNLEKLKANQLELAKGGMYFSEVVSEDPDGFIFATEIDSVVNYDFRHFKIQGDKEYLFQSGLIGNSTLDEIKLMYEIAQNAK